MKQVDLVDLQNNDEVAFIFPVDESGHYQTVLGQYKSFKYDEPEITGNNDTVVFINNTVELEFNALDGTRISKDTSVVLNLHISEEDRDTVLVFLIERYGKPVTK